jgi:hypothetical protein
VSNGRQQTITRHSKYFSPDISEDGQQLVAVEVNPQGSSFLQLLNSQMEKLSNRSKMKTTFFIPTQNFTVRAKLFQP